MSGEWLAVMNTPIMANDFKRLWTEAGNDVLAAVSKVGESGWYILGDCVGSFERHLAAYWKLNHAIGTANGMDALEIGLRILGLESGDKVLTTPLSAFASTLAILRAGGTPVFVDVDIQGNINLDLARLAIEKHSIRFILPVHLYGNPLNLGALETLKKNHNLEIVEDCAQAIGATWNGRTIGSVGQVAATSFYPTKNLGALGDAGALLTNDSALTELAKSYRDYGQKTKYQHSYCGLNSRLDEVQAAILENAMLPRLKTWHQRRKQIAQRYLSEIQNPSLRLLNLPSEAESAWHLFPVFTETLQHRTQLLKQLQTQGVGAAIHYPSLISEQEALAKVDFLICGELSQAKQLTETEVSLPIHPFLTDNEVTFIINTCNSWIPNNE